MYNVNNRYLRAIADNVRELTYTIKITTNAGNIYTFGDSDIVKGSGTIKRVICDDKLSIGNVSAGELDISLYTDIDRYELFGAECVVTATLNGTYSIPMGVFYVSECDRKRNVVSIVAYDAMTKLDKAMDVGALENSMNAYEWLKRICDSCGVKLALKSGSVSTLPNANLVIAFGGGVEDVTTFRDLLSYLASYLACNAFITRDGSLTIKEYSKRVTREIRAKERYSSEISDFVTYYTGMYATYVETGEAEYHENTEYSGKDDGLVYDLGVNPFLQITVKSNRDKAVQAILDSLSNAAYVPFNMSLPEYPELDVLDVIKILDNQAGAEDVGTITSLTYKLHGGMEISCAGENPLLTTIENRNDKNIQGLLNSGSQSTFVLCVKNAENIEVGGEVGALISDMLVATSADFTRCLVAFTATYTLADSELITVTVKLDETEVYTCKDVQLAGENTITVNTGVEIVGKGEHDIIVYMNSESKKPIEIQNIEARLAALEGA